MLEAQTLVQKVRGRTRLTTAILVDVVTMRQATLQHYPLHISPTHLSYPRCWSLNFTARPSVCRYPPEAETPLDMDSNTA